MRPIDADKLIETIPTVMDMQDAYLPIHFKEWLIDSAPTIDAVSVVHGKWIWGNEKKSWHKCSICGEQAYSYYDELADDVEELFDYCPHCGAKMDGERKGE